MSALFSRSAWSRSPGVAEALRTETVGGALLLVGRGDRPDLGELALERRLRAPADHRRRPRVAAPPPRRSRTWTADGLLAIFFLVAGIELKQEFVHGDLRDPAKAAVPVVAAVCGVVLPAVIYLAVTAGDPSARAGWAVPIATDIAFALAVLAVVGSAPARPPCGRSC